MKGVFGPQGPPRLGICDLKAQGQLWPLPFGPGSPPSPEPPSCTPSLSPGLLLGVFVWPWVSQAALAFFSQVSGFTSCWEDPPIHEPVTSQEVGLPTLHHQALGIRPGARKQGVGRRAGTGESRGPCWMGLGWGHWPGMGREEKDISFSIRMPEAGRLPWGKFRK